MRALLGLLGLLLIAPAHALQPNGHTLGGSEQFPLINGTGAFTSATAQDIANFVGNSGTIPANANLSTNPVTAAGPQTNSLSIWTSYLNGTSNPNAVVFGGAASLNGGGNLTGTFTGSPVFSGNPTFSGTVNLTGALSPASIATSGAANLTGGGALAGSFSGNPTFSGTPVLSTGTSIATGGTAARTMAARAADVINVLDYATNGSPACIGNATNDTAALTGAFAAATSHPGLTVFMPMCPNGQVWVLNSPGSAGIIVPSQTTLEGAGEGRTVITWNDDVAGNNLFMSAGTSGSHAVDVVLRNFTVRGKAQTLFVGSSSGFPIDFHYVDNLKIDHVTSEWSREMGIVVRQSSEVIVTNCTVRYPSSDGISVASTTDATINNNSVYFGNDDGISAHSETNDANGVRTNITIVGNRIFAAQGIKALGFRQGTISGNNLDFVMGQGINVTTIPAAGTGSEGFVAATGISITGNTITNLVNRAYVDNHNQGAPGIYISGSSARAGTYAAIPGENDTATGNVINPYPEFLANSNATTVPTAGSYGISVTGNTITRNLPPSDGTDARFTKVSDYGFAPSGFWTSAGFVNPSLPEAAFRVVGVQVATGAVHDVLISQNIIRGLGYGLNLSTAVNLNDIVFRDNSLTDISTDCFLLNNAGFNSVYVLGNTCDMDPLFLSTTRAVDGGGHFNGTWTSSTGPTGMLVQAGTGIVVKDNIFKNLWRDSNIATDAVTTGVYFENNKLQANPVSVGGYNAANAGVALARRNAGTQLIPTDSNPQSATFNNILQAPITNAFIADAYAPVFGTGADGSLVCSSGTTTLTRDMNYTNVTLSGTCAVVTHGWRLRAIGTCDLTAAPAAAIQFNSVAGNNASGATGGTTPTGNFPGSLPYISTTSVGGTGNTTTGTNPTLAISSLSAGMQTGASGAGGTGGASTSSGNAGLSGQSIATFNIQQSSIVPVVVGPYGGASQFSVVVASSLEGGPGGQGGGDGSFAGGGGGSPSYGGGMVGLWCRVINRGASTAVGAIQSKSGNGGNGGNGAGGNAAGGGGAGAGTGGTVFIVAETMLGTAATNAIDVSGGTGGTGGNGSGTGIGGTGGKGGGTGSVYVHVLGVPSFTATTPATAGTAATAASTATGTAGGSGAALQVNL